MSKYSRRASMKILGALPVAAQVTAAQLAAGEDTEAVSSSAVNRYQSSWENDHDRIWLGKEYWANPMEDWKIIDGAAECVTPGGNRNVHLITHQLTDPSQGFEMSVHVSQVSAGKTESSAGFLIGLKSELNETKSNCFAKKGTPVGIQNGELVVGAKKASTSKPLVLEGHTLKVVGQARGKKVVMTLEVIDAEGTVIETLSNEFASKVLTGNVAIATNFGMKGTPRLGGGRFRFRDWQVSGEAFTVDSTAVFGPILWTMYSLSDSRSEEGFVLKLSALTPPLGEDDNDEIQLQVRDAEGWKSLGSATVDHDAWTATFRIPYWDATKDVPFQVVYGQSHKDGDETFHDWTGTIKANPVGRPVKFAPLTCQNDYGFPYAPVAENLLRLDPDLLYFSGDQIYEGHGGYGIIRDPAEDAIVNYLRKYYQFGWAFREPMRHSPTLCLPDDHDVFQGNIWGEGGEAMKGDDRGASSAGGYREPVRMVNAVHKTCAGHHPDPFDPTPAKRGMTVYYGDLVYGGVSFAILGDRQFKSGPERVETGSGRADHVVDRDFDTKVLDKPGLELLGQRQEAFLKVWADDWRHAKVKVLLSQTVFAGVATHHGRYDGFLKGDLDSGGWPQTARDNAIDIIRKSKALHVNGDQHLTSICQYGVREQRDSNWSFCVPAISAGYPRWWRPDEEGMPHENRPFHGLDNTGEYLDGFGNKVYVYAVGNPVVGKSRNRYVKAHEKGSGFGWILIDPETETFECHSFRFQVDATDGNPDNEFPGWPITIHADDNTGNVRLFNGINLDGWHGQPHFDPGKLDAMPAAERAEQWSQWDAEAREHWIIENGELVNDGSGPYLTTNDQYDNYELTLKYKTVAEADSGIYLKGSPQVQIWDSTEQDKFRLGANLGSGGLWNNRAGTPGKNPLVLADRPFGEWNDVRIVQAGSRTSVWLNDKMVVDRAIMDNFWDRGQALRPRGPIQLQTHGGEIRWRDILLKPLDSDAANQYLSKDPADGFVSLTDGKTLDGWVGAVDDYEVTPEGSIRCKAGRGGNLLTADEYEDFVVRLFFKLPPKGNNGLAIRAPLKGNPAYLAMTELQVLDHDHPVYQNIDPRQAHGSAYGMAPATRGYLRPTGQWNFQEVTVSGSTIRVELNGSVILNADLNEVTDFMADSPHPGKDRKSGHFGFAGHSDPVEFRNVMIRRL